MVVGVSVLSGTRPAASKHERNLAVTQCTLTQVIYSTVLQAGHCHSRQTLQQQLQQINFTGWMLFRKGSVPHKRTFSWFNSPSGGAVSLTGETFENN